MESLKSELEKITVNAPAVNFRSDVKIEAKKSYSSNTTKEETILSYCQNFHRQFVHLYRDRRPVLLSRPNECSVEKFVCTTIRPTELRFKEIYDYHGCAEFVADYLNFEPLDPPIDLPAAIPSPTTVLKRQKGNCFDYSILLCSLLIGNGYDAYCVSGYANRETTLMDQTREVCPMVEKHDKKLETESQKELRKYTVKPPKDLQSKFELKMIAKEKAAEEANEKQRLQEERAKIEEREKPPVDKLHGLRVHSWVLVLSGKREVPESFFIESLTGCPKALDDSSYLGIESVWNHTNLWINMQDCSQGTKSLSFDLGDAAKWEYMFVNTDKPVLSLPGLGEDPLDDEDEEEEGEAQVDLPPSWVDKIEITSKEFHTRCPNGKKTVIYKKAKLEKFAEYLNRDGLVIRLSIYNDNELKELQEVKEYYKNREDKLESRTHIIATGQILESFLPGRQLSLKEHVYKASSPGPESDRIMHFYSNARVDGLVKREETPVSLSEYFENREDFLSYRHALFGKRVKKFGPQAANNRPIAKMTERFERDPSMPANENVRERTFAVSEDRIALLYHLENKRITSSTREFIKPPNYSSEKGTPLQLTPDATTAFQVDPYATDPKELDIYNMMVNLLEAEKLCNDKIRESEEEVREILDARMTEESVSKLTVSVYDTERNEKAKQRRTEMERKQREEEMRKRDMELDYLAPFLSRIGDPKTLSKPDAVKIREECLQDLKQRLIEKANLIQARFEKETQDLQKKQTWYQQNQMNMTKEDEEDYLNFCSEAMFRIHILELRLSRHKEMAPQKYMQLDEKLRNDHRLRDFL
ncbi:dynein regulatory complex subunit 7-like [Rhopilema esculentum]|uniref:dynein regulatory complex subunit 7-like n=1 Tax=Rhopilema esculentum TaxID=499914 RepID=UPI0031D1107C